jgi:hypothetical protein
MVASVGLRRRCGSQLNRQSVIRQKNSALFSQHVVADTFARFASLVTRYSIVSASRRWAINVEAPHSSPSRSGNRISARALCTAAARLADAGSTPARRSAHRRLRFLEVQLFERQAGGYVSVARALYRASSPSRNRRAAGWECSQLRISARGPALVGCFAVGAPPEPVVEEGFAGNRPLRSQSCPRAGFELPHNKPLQLSGRGICQARPGGRTAARFYCSRLCG